ncbi:SDR family oxidoreductase [Aeromicrobium fastidiosum]|uniref:SDR family oxidoreductase n=1 Tax=Aeromicrobium fastidiosum TaxID=52699 RepID=A0A641ARC9_9ACTN|nr:SDR family oxidoreductase [Aeromicrobium fastidiosum]KAA1380242.1 SDR family oxidoreductase [Aeromicrobium fastidiosum]MBP2389793.1 short-subunit dehydrogenase [Aeromicrobium fastidiosum]
MRTNVLITGASSGLGAGMARILAAKGHHLALTARRVDRLEALRDELLAAHPDIEVVVHALDVNDHDQVFAVFKRVITDLGGIDRVIVNAGLGKGGRIGTGTFHANKQTAETNFIAALAQCEAAMEHFYERKSGHLVVISSMSAMRGMPGSMTTYAATKAGIAMLAEGIRADLMGRKGLDIKVTTLYPGYIASEMNDGVEQESRMMVDTETGCRALVAKIEAEVVDAAVPTWPWAPLGQVLKHAPLGIVRRLV